MEIRNLKTFLQIVETGSFTKAAEVLGYTQSTVSFQIKQLEDELECQLFERVGRSVTLTDMGKKLTKHALSISHELSDISQSFKMYSEPEGQVRIFSSDSICEKMMLLNYSNFYMTYPKIKLVFSTGNTDDMLQILSRNEADVVFTLDTHIYREEFVIAKESPVELHFVTSTASPLASQKNLKIEDLLEYPFLLTEKGMSYRKILDNKLAEKSLYKEPVLEAGRTDILCYCIERGNGVGFLPDFVSETYVREGRLKHLEVEGFELTIWKQLIYHRDKWMSGALNAFLEFVKEHEFVW